MASVIIIRQVPPHEIHLPPAPRAYTILRAVLSLHQLATEVRNLFTSMLTGGLIKTALMTVLIVLAVIPLAICMEVADAGCAHACCTGADRSRPLQRALRRAKVLLKSAASMTLATLTDAAGFITAIAASLTLSPSPNQAVPLRI